jgi:biotin carboxyl carrier protein
MKYVAEAGGEQVEIELESADPDDVRASVDGRAYRLAFRELEPGVFRLERNGDSVEIAVTEDGRGYEVRVAGRRIGVEILDRRALLAGRSAGRIEGRTEVRAPMPGKIVRVLVEEGSSVERGQGLVVVEAMKMQNALRAAAPGRVDRVAVATGQRVDAGDLLVVLAPGDEPAVRS